MDACFDSNHELANNGLYSVSDKLLFNLSALLIIKGKCYVSEAVFIHYFEGL